jgi:hypothetical protein
VRIKRDSGSTGGRENAERSCKYSTRQECNGRRDTERRLEYQGWAGIKREGEDTERHREYRGKRIKREGGNAEGR